MFELNVWIIEKLIVEEDLQSLCVVLEDAGVFEVFYLNDFCCENKRSRIFQSTIQQVSNQSQWIVGTIWVKWDRNDN